MDTEVLIVDALVDIHVHLRDAEHMRRMEDLIRYSIMGGADVLLPMPNTSAWLKNVDEVLIYKKLCEVLVPKGYQMTFVPTVAIHEHTADDEIIKCARGGILDAKIYPKDRTTNSAMGVSKYAVLLPLIKIGGSMGMRFHFHPEHPNMLFGNRDAEYLFLPIVEMFLQQAKATIIWEHGTDARCIPFWKEWGKTGRFFVTLTAHHLLTDEDATFGDVRATCKPPIKTARDSNDLRLLVYGNYPWVMAGSDSAYHPREAKHPEEGKCACGAFTAPNLVELYLESLGEPALGKSDEEHLVTLNNFLSRNARRIYNLPAPSREIKLFRNQNALSIPTSYPVGDQFATPFWAGKKLKWSQTPERQTLIVEEEDDGCMKVGEVIDGGEMDLEAFDAINREIMRKEEVAQEAYLKASAHRTVR